MTIRSLRFLAALAAVSGGASPWLPSICLRSTSTRPRPRCRACRRAASWPCSCMWAYSATFKKGAGVVAGGPFYCAEGSVVPMPRGAAWPAPSGIPTSTLISTTSKLGQRRACIDPVANLQASKVYLFSGTLDSVVKPGAMDALQDLLQQLCAGSQHRLQEEHRRRTRDDHRRLWKHLLDQGRPLYQRLQFRPGGRHAGPYLRHAESRNSGTLPEGNFVEFNQSQFITNHGMAPTGWAYIPQACTTGTQCRLHVVLHGCQQNVTLVQQKYVRNTGYNRWADTNNMVMLYPQTSTAATNSCWDWWGYDSANYAKKVRPANGGHQGHGGPGFFG
jgi:hypothetical protein